MMELNSAWHPLSIQYYSKGKFGSLHITRKVCQVIRMSDRAAFWILLGWWNRGVSSHFLDQSWPKSRSAHHIITILIIG